MVEADPLEPAQREQPSAKKGPRAPLSFALFLFTFALGALLSTLALTAALLSLGLWAAFGLGVVVAVGLPLFLVLRAGAALRRRGIVAWARHLVSLLLAAITHAALFGVCLDWVDRSTGDLFLVADALLDKTVGEVPLLSGILQRHSEGATVALDGAPRPPQGNGPTSAGDGGPDDVDGDAGPLGGVKPAPSPLSPRATQGRPVGAALALARTDKGGYAAIVTVVDAGGAVRLTTVDLSALVDEGGPTAADAAKDGGAAFVLGAGKLVYVEPGGKPRALAMLARGARLSSAKGAREIRQLHDVAIAPGGGLLVVADVVAADAQAGSADVLAALLAYHPKKPGGAFVVRQGGDEIPDAPAGSTSSGFALSRAGPAGHIAVVESFFEGGDGSDVDQRVLSGRVDEPHLLAEVARSRDAVQGLPERSLASFLDAFVLADGRTVVDADFLEAGAGGWLFVARAAGAPVPLAPDAMTSGKAPFTSGSPRALHLVGEPDGRFAFTKAGAGIVVADVARPLEGVLLAPGLRAFVSVEGGAVAAGVADELARPTLTQGGDFVLMSARLDGARRALLMASRDDVKNGVAEVLVEEQRPLSRGDELIRSLDIYDWRQGPAVGTSP